MMEYFYEVMSETVVFNKMNQAVLVTLYINGIMAVIDEINESNCEKLYRNYMNGQFSDTDYFMIIRDGSQSILEVFKLNLNDEFPQDCIRHVLNLSVKSTVKKISVLEEYEVPEEIQTSKKSTSICLKIDIG